MSDGMGREFTYLSSHATNRYFIPNWGIISYVYPPWHYFTENFRPLVTYVPGFSPLSVVAFLRTRIPPSVYISCGVETLTTLFIPVEVRVMYNGADSESPYTAVTAYS